MKTGSECVLDILWITDPHLDHLGHDDCKAWFQRIESFQGSGILITGDIGESDSVCEFLEQAARLHSCIWFVLGNHDYYGSTIGDTRARVLSLSERVPSLHYLSQTTPIYHGDTSVLIGVDGWSDGRAGDFLSSPVMLNDYRRIGDLSGLEITARLRKLKDLGDSEAAVIRRKLETLDISAIRKIRIATHVPPFAEACWYEGSNAVNEWTPHFTGLAVGYEILRFAEANPQIQFEVYCGHGHNAGQVTLSSNILVETGAAVYGDWKPHRVLTWQ